MVRFALFLEDYQVCKQPTHLKVSKPNSAAFSEIAHRLGCADRRGIAALPLPMAIYTYFIADGWSWHRSGFIALGLNGVGLIAIGLFNAVGDYRYRHV